MRCVIAWLLMLAWAASAAPAPDRKVFIVRNAIRDVDEFRELAAIAARLKPFGEVQVDVGLLADKGWHDVPEGGSPWHEFGTYNSAAFKFFPHAKIAPHLPAEWVANSRKLLLAKAAILREFGLAAAFTSNFASRLRSIARYSARRNSRYFFSSKPPVFSPGRNGAGRSESCVVANTACNE